MMACTWRCSSAGFARATFGGGLGGGRRGPLRRKGEDIGAACGQLKELQIAEERLER